MFNSDHIFRLLYSRVLGRLYWSNRLGTTDAAVHHAGYSEGRPLQDSISHHLHHG